MTRVSRLNHEFRLLYFKTIFIYISKFFPTMHRIWNLREILLFQHTYQILIFFQPFTLLNYNCAKTFLHRNHKRRKLGKGKDMTKCAIVSARRIADKYWKRYKHVWFKKQKRQRNIISMNSSIVNKEKKEGNVWIFWKEYFNSRND